MRIDFLITTDDAVFKDYHGIKIKYASNEVHSKLVKQEAVGEDTDHGRASAGVLTDRNQDRQFEMHPVEAIQNDYFTIGNYGLLFECDIHEQDIQCFEVDNYKAFFKRETADLSFDILSASFYLLSRYEEYLPHKKDMYGRYAHENSLAFKENFLHIPLINSWVNHFAKILQNKFPRFIIPYLSANGSFFSFIPSYDVDMAFSYKHKGWLRNAGSFIKSPSLNRIKVLLGLNKDPFDSYDWLNELHNHYQLNPLYFFLIAEKNSRYDKNILPQKKQLQILIQQHAKKYEIGIHPSWQSGDLPELFQKEKRLLEAMIEAPVKMSRQHYIRFNLPAGYRNLQHNGIDDDYSMGYGSINGFRASVATSFYWYDLQRDETTILRIHPFCFMDANSFYEQKFKASEAYDELMQYYTVCKEVGGQLITVWHNNFLGNEPQFIGWKDMYERFIGQIH